MARWSALAEVPSILWARERAHMVGNVMIDSLLRHLPAARFDRIRGRFPVEERRYAVLTLHRPANVDRPEPLAAMLQAVRRIAADLPVVSPAHPRTRRRLAELGLTACPLRPG